MEKREALSSRSRRAEDALRSATAEWRHGHRRASALVDRPRAALGRLERHERVLVVTRTAKDCSRDRITTSAASLAFHWFLAIFPAVLALVGVAHLVGLSPAAIALLVRDLGVLLPRQAAEVVVQALRSPLGRRASLAEAVIGSGVALWSAIEAMASLQVGLDIAFEVSRDRGFVGRRLMAFPLLGLTVTAGFIGFGLLVLGRPVGRLLAHDVPLAGSLFAAAWTVVRVVGALAAISLLLSGYFSLGPRRERLRWQWSSPGSVLATLGWLAVSLLYSFYLDDIGHSSRDYGALAGVATLLLWLFLTATIVLVGAELDKELARLAAEKASPPEGDHPVVDRSLPATGSLSAHGHVPARDRHPSLAEEDGQNRGARRDAHPPADPG